jgi:predicted TIM-barrel fold metal-dependent hydrolase
MATEPQTTAQRVGERYNGPLISADSHITPPPDLFVKRLPAQLRHRAPHIERREDGDWMVIEGRTPWRAGREEKKPSERDPEARLEEVARDGVVAEVMYALGIRRGDAELSLACARAYNDWIAEVFGPYRRRLAPAAPLPPFDIQGAIAELRRIAKLGLRPAVLPDHVDEEPYNSPRYEPLWAEAEALGIPLSFHVGGGRDSIRHKGLGATITNYALVTSGMVETLSHLAAAGILERHPGLRVVLVECGTGWLAWAMQALDEAHVKHARWTRPKLAEPPSEYIRRQVKVTFQDDRVGVATRAFTGAHMLMWGSDYPHHEGTWPNSREAIARQFAGAPEADVRKIVFENARDLYGFSAGAG